MIGTILSALNEKTSLMSISICSENVKVYKAGKAQLTPNESQTAGQEPKLYTGQEPVIIGAKFAVMMMNR